MIGRPRPPCRRLLASIVSVWALSASAVAVADVDPFYSTRLREGTTAYERGRYGEAAESLRVACFGLLDEGPTLVGCLVRLGLAQARLDEDGAFRETFQRLVEAEELLGLYGTSELPQGLRSAFEAEVTSRIPEVVLGVSPGFRHLAKEEPAGEDPSPGPATAIDDREPGGEPEDSEGRLAEARRRMGEARVREDLDRAYDLVLQVLDRDPAHREARLLAGEIAYRGSRWELAVEHFHAAGDVGGGRCELLFYSAVALYETGRTDEAAATLRRCEGRLSATPFVERYRRLILSGD